MLVIDAYEYKKCIFEVRVMADPQFKQLSLYTHLHHFRSRSFFDWLHSSVGKALHRHRIGVDGQIRFENATCGRRFFHTHRHIFAIHTGVFLE